MPYGIVNTAENNFTRPYGGQNPFAPAGTTDMTKQGWTTGLQGQADQMPGARNYADAMAAQQASSADAYNQLMAGGANRIGGGGYSGYSSSRDGGSRGGGGGYGSVDRRIDAAIDQPQFDQAGGMIGQALQRPGFGQAGGMIGQALERPGFGQAAGLAGQAYNRGGFGRAAGLAQRAPDRRGFGQSAGMINNTMGQYGGGWSGGMANAINQTGASFNPFNPMVGQLASAANQQLARDFIQSVMPGLNRAAGKAGAGAYGGTRAGVAQGIREQGLADAMQRQTTGMYGQAYEAGLGRYVQDRGQTLGAAGEAMRTGGALGLQGAQQRANIANMRGQLMGQSAQTVGNIANQRGQLMGQSAQTLGSLANMQGALGMQGAQQWGNLANMQGALGMQGAQQMGALGNMQGQLGMQGANIKGGMANAQAAADATVGAANVGAQARTAIANQQEQNRMFQWGHGEMLPNNIRNTFDASQTPGGIMQGMGQSMNDIGNAQQYGNQATLDWMNQNYNNAQGYPDQRLNNYVAQAGPYLRPGNVPQQMVGQTTPSNPYGNAMGGAFTGAGAYNQYQTWKNNQPGNGGGYNPGPPQYTTGPQPLGGYGSGTGGGYLTGPGPFGY